MPPCARCARRARLAPIRRIGAESAVAGVAVSVTVTHMRIVRACASAVVLLTHGEVVGESRSIDVEDGSFTDDHARWDVHVYRFAE